MKQNKEDIDMFNKCFDMTKTAAGAALNAVKTAYSVTESAAKTVVDVVVAHPKEAVIVVAAVACVVASALIVSNLVKKRKNAEKESKSFRDAILNYFTNSKKTTVTFETKEEIGQ